MEKLQFNELNQNKVQNLEELIEINSILNQREENLTQIQQQIEIQNLKNDSISICKMCMDEKCIDINKNLCNFCSKRVKSYRISNTLFISGCIIGSSVSGIGFSLGGLSVASLGLSLGTIFQNLYNYYLFWRC